MTRNAVLSPLAQRANAAATCASVSLSGGEAVVIALSLALRGIHVHPTKRPEPGQLHREYRREAGLDAAVSHFFYRPAGIQAGSGAVPPSVAIGRLRIEGRVQCISRPFWPHRRL